MSKFKLVSEYEPAGDQPQAIDGLVDGLNNGKHDQVLLGVTGSGKTFTIAQVISKLNRPALIMAPNKTLAAQLFAEFKELFPENAVEYFVSYYDYYQPEAYLPAQDLYIEKDSAINERIDKLRHSATRSLLTRRDVIIVASVSCIYGLGSPEAYKSKIIAKKKGETVNRNELLMQLVKMQYQRNDYDFHRGTFRVRGQVVEIFPAYEDALALRLEFFGDELENIAEIDPLTGKKIRELDSAIVFPGSHYVTDEGNLENAIKSIKAELKQRLKELNRNGKVLEKARIKQRTEYDLELLEEMDHCKGIENYSRHLTGRKPGAAPPTLLEYFPKDFLMFMDESHISVPQVRGMFMGDKARKTVLVEHGFRLPSALDNRPLNFEEFEKMINQVVYVSATPAEYELQKSNGEYVEQVVRPTGLLDPEVEVRKVDGQIENLLKEIKIRSDIKERVLVTTLTKRLAEDLTEFLREKGVKVRYLHSDIDTMERIEIIRGLRLGNFDVLVGINLLREGLDIPEVSMVAILDADREGFLRSTRSLIQTFGRASRNVSGKAILYADKITDSMRRAIDETKRRRKLQLKYNKKHGITPKTIVKKISDIMRSIYEKDYSENVFEECDIPLKDLSKRIKLTKKEMKKAAENLEFEKAGELRDELFKLENMMMKES